MAKKAVAPKGKHRQGRTMIMTAKPGASEGRQKRPQKRPKGAGAVKRGTADGAGVQASERDVRKQRRAARREALRRLHEPVRTDASPVDVLARNIKKPEVQGALALVLFDLVLPLLAAVAVAVVKDAEDGKAPKPTGAPPWPPGAFKERTYDLDGAALPATVDFGSGHAERLSLIRPGAPACTCPSCSARRAREAN